MVTPGTVYDYDLADGSLTTLKVQEIPSGYDPSKYATERLKITVRDGKGGKDRVTVLPASLVEPLRRQLETARALHELDLREGFGHVYLPFALARKYPNADLEWCWQYVFPARHRSQDRFQSPYPFPGATVSFEPTTRITSPGITCS